MCRSHCLVLFCLFFFLLCVLFLFLFFVSFCAVLHVSVPASPESPTTHLGIARYDTPESGPAIARVESLPHLGYRVTVDAVLKYLCNITYVHDIAVGLVMHLNYRYLNQLSTHANCRYVNNCSCTASLNRIEDGTYVSSYVSRRPSESSKI
ncbi:hypothetical protein P167DRAFT_356474 [Morchella conica CCBAS932]|uniref:Uncharacterized protein n=1 Tax=Morchella conica CCBAS932 TaxID=1392247 RepID=A0A3N4KFY7_9PEZI|nr:hypothetical protein P167DRAFT_356474 [Morchella conica CCBAS932]